MRTLYSKPSNMIFSPHNMTDIIPASSIDYRNVDEICGYRLLLCKIYECEGGFNLPVQTTPLTREIKRQSKIWLREVKSLIESTPTLAAIPPLLSGYDILYRIAHGIPCHDYLREVKLRTADRWLKGDKSISRTDVVLLLLSETDRNIRTLEERYSKYAIRVMTSWVDELMKNGTFTDTPLSETYRRLSYLLDTDLFVYAGRGGQVQVKSQWARTHRLSEEQLDALDTDTLWAYAHFIESVPFTTSREYEHDDSAYMHILSKIASRPDTHPYAAKAIELTFKRLATLIA